eukprot:309044-Rhodomonas_salina.2
MGGRLPAQRSRVRHRAADRRRDCLRVMRSEEWVVGATRGRADRCVGRGCTFGLQRVSDLVEEVETSVRDEQVVLRLSLIGDQKDGAIDVKPPRPHLKGKVRERCHASTLSDCLEKLLIVPPRHV